MKTLLILGGIGLIGLMIAFPPFAFIVMFILFIYSLPDSLNKYLDD